MTKADERKVRIAAKMLLKRLTEERPKVLVQDWYKDSQTRLAVRDEVDTVLNKYLPEEIYDKDLFMQKRDKVFELTLDLAINHQRWAALWAAECFRKSMQLANLNAQRSISLPGQRCSNSEAQHADTVLRASHCWRLHLPRILAYDISRLPMRADARWDAPSRSSSGPRSYSCKTAMKLRDWFDPATRVASPMHSPRSTLRNIQQEVEAMSARQKIKYVHEGRYVAEVSVEVDEPEVGW